MKKRASVLWICLLSPVLSCTTLGSFGCAQARPDHPFSRDATFHRQYETTAEPPQAGPPLSRQLESAQAEAVVAVLTRTTYLERFKSAFGAVFFQGVSSNAIKEVSVRVGGKLPRLLSSVQGLNQDKWIDKKTGKPAMLLEAETVSADSREPVFRIVTRITRRGGNMCRAEMKKVDDGWEVARFEVLIAD